MRVLLLTGASVPVSNSKFLQRECYWITSRYKSGQVMPF